MSDVDVIVAGGGPGGSTAAHLLAKAGLSVRLFERETFPRFHIGESLLPCNLPILDTLGLDLSTFEPVRKRGAEFLDERTGQHEVYPFDEALAGGPEGYAYQVDRAVFDDALMKLAIEHGVDARFGQRVDRTEVKHDHVEVHVGNDVHTARYVLDATGQSALFARKQRSIAPLKGFGVMAVYTRFTNLSDAVRHELETEREGNVIVLIRQEGWGWVIPLPNGVFGCGLVTTKRGLADEAFLLDAISESPLLQRLTAGATRGPIERAGNFAFKNVQPFGARWGCVGDASAFLDPVFSSGVAFAMLGAEHAARALVPALRERREDDPSILLAGHEHMMRAYDTFGSLVHRFYHTNLVEHFFFAIDPDPEIRAGLISVLAGDVWREDNKFQQMLLHGRHRFAMSEVGVQSDAAE